MKVIKRNGSTEEFNLDKVLNAVFKAYKSQNQEVQDDVLKEVIYAFEKEAAGASATGNGQCGPSGRNH